MCNKSESITNLAVALAKFNTNVQRIEKDATNPHFKNRYASLDSILDEVRPMLAEQGLSILQMPSGDAEQLKLKTMLVHISGEWIESDSIVMKPSKSDPQGIGSATTYARRYGLCAFLGLSTGELDDDANAASTPPRTTQQQPQSVSPTQPQNAPTTAQGSVAMISDAQVGFVKKLVKDKKISDDDYRKMIAPKTSTKDLTMVEAKKLINDLQAYVEPKPEISDDDLPF